MEKFKSHQIGRILAHDSRVEKDGVTRSNEQIDDNRTHLNYNLSNHANAVDYMRQRLREVSVMKRANVVLLGSWCVTLPQDFKGDEKAFFSETYKFLSDRYGAKNVVSAWVHKDETQPHLHFKFVPVVEKNGKEKVCMKECCNRLDLQTFHTDLQSHLEEVLQCKVGILNGATDNGNRTIKELKMQELKKYEDELEERAETLVEQVDTLREICGDLTEEYKTLLGATGTVEGMKLQVADKVRKQLQPQIDELTTKTMQQQSMINQQHEEMERLRLLNEQYQNAMDYLYDYVDEEVYDNAERILQGKEPIEQDKGYER